MFNLNAVDQGFVDEFDFADVSSENFRNKIQTSNVSTLLFLIEKYKDYEYVTTLLKKDSIWFSLLQQLFLDPQFNLSMKSWDKIGGDRIVISGIMDNISSLRTYMKNSVGSAQVQYFQRKIELEMFRLKKYIIDTNLVSFYDTFLLVWDSMAHIEFNEDNVSVTFSDSYEGRDPGERMYGSGYDLIYWVEPNVVYDTVVLHQTPTDASNAPIFMGFSSGNSMANLDDGKVSDYNPSIVDFMLSKADSDIVTRSGFDWVKRASMAIAGVSTSYFSVLGMVTMINHVLQTYADLEQRIGFNEQVISEAKRNLRWALDDLKQYGATVVEGTFSNPTKSTIVTEGGDMVLTDQTYFYAVEAAKVALDKAIRVLEATRQSRDSNMENIITGIQNFPGAGNIMGLFQTMLQPASDLITDSRKYFEFDVNTLDSVMPNPMKTYNQTSRDAIIIITAPNKRDIMKVFKLIRMEGRSPIIEKLNVYKHVDLFDGRLNAQISCSVCDSKKKKLYKCHDCDKIFCSEKCHSKK